MTLPDAVAGLLRYGYARRHAAFLTCVLAHGGYFLRRQLLAATERPDGAVITTFLRRLVARGYVRRATCARRTQLYHVHHPFFYDALGDPNSPFQRRREPQHGGDALGRRPGEPQAQHLFHFDHRDLAIRHPLLLPALGAKPEE
jgi:hypothetical protein